MKERLPIAYEQCRQRHPMYPDAKQGSIEGFFMIPFSHRKLAVLSGKGYGWDHVSVSLPTRCPHWNEMCFIKGIFFGKEETVLQFHPPMSEYINVCQTVLHLWRPWDQTVELPPDWMLV